MVHKVGRLLPDCIVNVSFTMAEGLRLSMLTQSSQGRFVPTSVLANEGYR
jgi:hypothetical protein